MDLRDLHDDLRAVARDLLARPGADWSAMADAGWSGLEVPEALEGAGASFAELAVVLGELGRAAAPSPALGTAVLGVGALLATPASDERDDLLRGVAAGTVRLAAALAPSGDAALAAAPFRVDGGHRVHGSASFVPDAGEADRLLLLAEDDAGSPVLACVDPSAVQRTALPVLDETRRFATVVADGAEATVWALEGDPQRLLDRGALAVACDSLGLAAAMLDTTVAYAGVRRQFDRPIGSFQAVKHRCADMLVGVTVGRELLAAAVEAVASDDPDAGTAVAMASSYVCAAAVEVAGAAMQLHGGIGYTWESGIHVHLKRATLNRSLLGSPAAQRRRLSARLVSGPGRTPG